VQERRGNSAIAALCKYLCECVVACLWLTHSSMRRSDQHAAYEPLALHELGKKCCSATHTASQSNEMLSQSCEVLWYNAQVFQGSNTGVFVGCMWLEYGELLTAHGAGGGAFVVTGNGLAFLAGRLSYAFGFTGPCVPTNTGVPLLCAQLCPAASSTSTAALSRSR